jgi:hypothetical protein
MNSDADYQIPPRARVRKQQECEQTQETLSRVEFLQPLEKNRMTRAGLFMHCGDTDPGRKQGFPDDGDESQVPRKTGS